MFTKLEIELLQKLGLDYDYSKELSFEQVIKIEEAIEDLLLVNCADEEGSLTDDGRLCCSILMKIEYL